MSDELANLVKTQQETIDYLLQYIERVEIQLNDRIDTLEAKPAPPQPPPQLPAPPPRFQATSPEDPDLIERLSGFVVDTLEEHQLHHAILPCWYLHSAAIRELKAMMELQGDCTNAEQRSALGWQFEQAGARVKQYLRRCRAGHSPDIVASWLTEDYHATVADHIRELRQPSTG